MRLSLFLAPITALAALAGCSRGYNVYRRPVTTASEDPGDGFELDVRGSCKNLQEAVNKTYEAAIYHCARWVDAAEYAYRGEPSFHHRRWADTMEYWYTRAPSCEQGSFRSVIEVVCK